MTSGLAALGGVSATASPPGAKIVDPKAENRRDLFPRLEHDCYVNAARATPLSTFTADGLRRFEEYRMLGPGDDRGTVLFDMLDEIRGDFGRLIGAKPSEIALTSCTKAGEHIVLQGLPGLRAGGNVVTNDFHFSGSLHHLIGLKKAGHDVRIVKSRGWSLDLEAMEAAIDERTELVAVTLVSNVNGRIEPMEQLSEIAHRHGALVYADIIQAAGIVPLDMRRMGIDFAACNGYKWLFGVYGAAFFFVREEHQGSALEDQLFPGRARHLDPPWNAEPTPDGESYSYKAPTDARRYEPGHVSYLGFCGLHAGLRFIHDVGVDTLLQHSVELNQRLVSRLDPDRYPCISPDLDRSPIVTFTSRENESLRRRLEEAGVDVTLSGNRIRVSPAIYNTVDDIDLVAEVLGRSPA